MIDQLKKYFEETPKEKVLEDWAKSESFDEVGPTMDEFLLAHNLKWNNRYSETDQPDKAGRLARQLFYKEKHVCLITLHLINNVTHYKVIDYFPSNGNDSPCYAAVETHDLVVLMHRAEQRFLKFLNEIR
jgi:hypothetical protein